MASLQRIVRLLTHPRTEWDRIARESSSVDDLLRNVLLPLALLTPAATVAGMLVFDRTWNPLYGYQVPPERVFAAGAESFVLIVGAVFAIAAIFTLIVPMFGGGRSFVRSLRVAIYGAIPVLLAGATLVLPMMAVLALVPLGYTVFLYGMGARRVLGVPAGGEGEFLGVSFVLLCVVGVLACAAAEILGLL